jgi:hypothetical protein
VWAKKHHDFIRPFVHDTEAARESDFWAKSWLGFTVGLAGASLVCFAAGVWLVSSGVTTLSVSAPSPAATSSPAPAK